MITEDQLEQLAIQWFKDTGGENIEHRTPNIERRSEEERCLVVALRTLTPALCLRPSPLRSGSQGEKEEDWRLAARLRDAMPGQVLDLVTKPEHPIGRPFRAWNPVGDGTQGDALGCRMLPRWGVCNSQGFLVSQNQINRKLNP